MTVTGHYVEFSCRPVFHPAQSDDGRLNVEWIILMANYPSGLAYYKQINFVVLEVT
jgi:hypothetical protein